MSFKAIAKQLKRDFMPRAPNGCHCAICGTKNLPLAFHLLEQSYVQNAPTPMGFVPMSMSIGMVRGVFPVCINCAPPCSKCGLPIPTEKAMEFGVSIGARTGNGACSSHIHLAEFLKVIFKRLFRIGRFGKSLSRAAEFKTNTTDQDYLAPIDPDQPTKSMEELWREGKISAKQYRSVLFLMKTGASFSSSPNNTIGNIDKKIEELTEYIEQGGKNGSA